MTYTTSQITIWMIVTIKMKPLIMIIMMQQTITTQATKKKTKKTVPKVPNTMSNMKKKPVKTLKLKGATTVKLKGATTMMNLKTRPEVTLTLRGALKQKKTTEEKKEQEQANVIQRNMTTRKQTRFLNVTNPSKDDRVKIAKHITGIVMTQLEPENQQKKIYYWKKGVKVMGEDAIKAIVKEAKQLDDKETFKPMRSANLTNEQKKGALESITTVTKKRCRRVKGWTCADGRKQWECMSKEEELSPTVSLEGRMTIILTALHEER